MNDVIARVKVAGQGRVGPLVGLLVAFAAAPNVSGCDASRTGEAPEAPVWKQRAGWAMGVEFRRDLVADTRRTGEPYERGEPEIDVVGRRVFVGSSDGGLYAINAVTGETIYRFETLGFVQGAPLYDAKEDVVYFGANDGALYKIKADGGELLWRLRTNAEVARRPVLSGKLLYVTNANDTLLAVDPASGKVVWAQHRTPALGMEVAGYSGAALANGLVYMGFSDGTATAFDAVSGQQRWQPVDLAAEAEQVLGEIPTYLDVDTTPVPLQTTAGDLVIFGSYAGGVFGLEAESGVQVWSNPAVLGVSDFELWEEPAQDRNGVKIPARRLLLVAAGTTGLWALEPDTGAEVWRRDLPHGGVSRPVAVAGALLVNASQLGTYLLSPIDGSLIDGIHMTNGASSVPAAYGTRAFVLTNAGYFYGLHIRAPETYADASIPTLDW